MLYVMRWFSAQDSGAGQSGDDPDSDSSDLTCGLNTAPAEHKTDTGEKSAPQSPVPSAAPAGTSSGEARAGAAPVPGEAMVRRAEPRADGYVGAIEDTRAVAVWRQLSWERVRVGARPPVPAPAPGVELRSQVDGGGRRPGAPREALARLACGSVASDRARARQAQQDQSPAGRAPVAAAPGERSVAGRLGIAGTLKGRQRGAESKESKTGGESKAGGGAEEVRWLARNDKWVPIHVEVHVACAGGGARGDVGRVARVVPPRSEAFVVATVAVEAREVAARLEATWSFGLGDPWAVHSARVRYALPYTGRARHVCQSFGGRFSHSGRLHYSVDFDLPVGHQVRAARAGVVCAVKDSSDEGGASRKFADMANYVHILHPDNTVGPRLPCLAAPLERLLRPPIGVRGDRSAATCTFRRTA
jgi:murein DD-endopeptidase MepM/ murein hydrolase activator NlpD